MAAQVAKNADFRQDTSSKLDKAITDLNGKINQLRMTASQQQDAIVKMKAQSEVHAASSEKHERTIEQMLKEIDSMKKEIEKLHIIK